MELEALYVEGSIGKFRNKQAARIAKLVRLLDMSVTLTEATNGRILHSDLIYIGQAHQFRLQREDMRAKFAQMNAGIEGGPIKRVG